MREERAVEADDDLISLNRQLLNYAEDLRKALEKSATVSTELERAHLETVAALAAAVDVRDEVTGGHVYRVANYGIRLAEHLAPEVARDPQLVYGFLLHDIGKLAVPDSVLQKDGPLTPDELDQMRAHVEYGVKFVQQIGFLRPALQVVATHHEAWDGSGYPRRLRGEEIPFVTRMFTACDAFDAMIHDRPYRDAMPPEHALAELEKMAGTQFDPQVIAGFEEVLDRILEVDDRPTIPPVRNRDVRPSRELALDGSVVFEAMEEGLLLLGPDGVVLDANEAFVHLFGLGRPPVGMTMAELMERVARRFARPEAARQEALAIPRELFAQRTETTYTLIEPHPKLVRRVAHTLYSEDGDVIGRLLVFHEGPDPTA